MKFAILLSILFSFSLLATTRYLIIHGTWSKQFDWFMPGGDFYDALANQIPPGTVSFFLWSGKNRDDSRREAAQKLVEYIQLFYSSKDELILIGHSHGGNVALLASQLMGNIPNNQHHIHTLFTLGTPISKMSYWPDMNVIEKLYNLFSFNDFVQPVLGCFEREFPAHERITNIEVIINRKEPQHPELHHPLIARYIPHLQEIVKSNENSVLYLNDDEEPCIIADLDREYKHERDRQILFAMNHIMYYQWGRNQKIFRCCHFQSS